MVGAHGAGNSNLLGGTAREHRGAKNHNQDHGHKAPVHRHEACTSRPTGQRIVAAERRSEWSLIFVAGVEEGVGIGARVECALAYQREHLSPRGRVRRRSVRNGQRTVYHSVPALTIERPPPAPRPWTQEVGPSRMTTGSSVRTKDSRSTSRKLGRSAHTSAKSFSAMWALYSSMEGKIWTVTPS
jgi:hypothetical protein